MFVKIEVRCVAGMFPEIGQALVDRQTADLVGESSIHAGGIVSIDIEAVIPAAAAGSFLHTHGEIGHGGDSGA